MKADATVKENNKGSVVVSWTGGKDGCFACHKAILEGFCVSHLLNFMDTKKSGSHEINPELLSLQSEAIGIPILRTNFISYEQEFKKVVRDLKAGGVRINGAVFGHIKTHKGLVDRICSDLSIKSILPIWNCSSEKIIADLIDAGFDAIVISAKADLFDEEWLGRKIDKNFLSDLHRFNDAIDPCGEYGEFHTFIVDGPIFEKKLRIVDSRKILKDGYWFLDILKCGTEEK
ncbi:MAG: diphthine--ammonia ligase [Euryarchaeota archaeon]|nr:diphthine--ammonia ligase [Euryarchaeota archaeon]